MSHCLQNVFVDFMEFLLKRHLKYLSKSSNKLIKNKKFNVDDKNKFKKSILKT